MPPAAIQWTSSTATSWRAWCEAHAAGVCPTEELSKKNPRRAAAPAGDRNCDRPVLLIERHHLESGSLEVHGRVEQERAVRAVLQQDAVRPLGERHVVRTHVRRVSRV